jgi:hypothetical protein
MAKANASKKVKFLEVEENDMILTFTLGDGQVIEFDYQTVNEEMRDKAMLHGFNQKIRDAAAGFSDAKGTKGTGDDYDGAFEAMTSVIEALQNGDWTRKGSTGGLRGLKYLPAAIARIKGVSEEKAAKAVAAATQEQKVSWMKNPTIAAHIAQIMADALKAKAAGSDLDIEFEDEEEEGTEQ